MLLSDEKIIDEFKFVEDKPTDVVDETIVEEDKPITEDVTLEDDKPITDDVVLEDNPIEPVAEEKPADTDISLEEEKPFDISKYTDGEFTKVDDLVKAYREQKENVITGDNLMEYLDKQSQAEFQMSFAEVVEWKNTDYSKMDELELLAEYELFKDHEVTDEEIDAELEEFKLLTKSDSEIKQMIEDEDLTQKEYDSLKVKLTKKARIARNELTAHRDSLELGKIKVPTSMQKEEAPQPTEEEVNKSKALIREGLDSINKLKINVGGKDNPTPLDFMVTKDEKDNLYQTITSGNWIMNRWKNEDGTINQKSAYRDAYVLNYLNKIVSTAYNEGTVNGKKQQVISEDNITLKDGKVTPPTSSMNDLEELTKQMMG